MTDDNTARVVLSLKDVVQLIESGAARLVDYSETQGTRREFDEKLGTVNTVPNGLLTVSLSIQR